SDASRSKVELAVRHIEFRLSLMPRGAVPGSNGRFVVPRRPQRAIQEPNMSFVNDFIDGLSFRGKLLLLGSVGALVIITLAVFGSRSIHSLAGAANVRSGPAANLRQQMMVDMMHDGMKGNVFITLYKTGRDSPAMASGGLDPAVRKELLD